MAQQIHISLPDDQFQQIAALAAKQGLSPEELARQWLAERQRQEMDEHEVFPGIVSNPRIHNGEPVIKGTRIQAILIARFVEQGATEEELQEDYHLTAEQIQAAVDFMGAQNKAAGFYVQS